MYCIVPVAIRRGIILQLELRRRRPRRARTISTRRSCCSRVIGREDQGLALVRGAEVEGLPADLLRGGAGCRTAKERGASGEGGYGAGERGSWGLAFGQGGEELDFGDNVDGGGELRVEIVGYEGAGGGEGEGGGGFGVVGCEGHGAICGDEGVVLIGGGGGGGLGLD